MAKKEMIIIILIGIFSGFINGLLGSGGGMIIVPLLTKFLKIDRNTAHINSVFMIFNMCIVSSFMYLSSGVFDYKEVIPYLPLGIVGAIVGANILPKVNKKVLKNMFGIFSVWCGIRLLIR